MEKKYNCTCYVKNVHDEIGNLSGEVYVAGKSYLKVEFPKITGFYASNFSLSIDDIYEYKIISEDELEIVCFTDTYSLSHVDAEYKELNNYLYKFTIHIKEVKALYKDISVAKKKKLKKKKENIEICKSNLRTLKNYTTITEKAELKNYTKVKGSYGRTIPKKNKYTGYAFESAYEDCLIVQFDDTSEKRYIEQTFVDALGQTKIFIKYNEIKDYYIKSKKLHIKVFNNGDFNEIKNLLYFGDLIENDVFEIILEGEEIQKVKKLLSKRVVLEENEVNIENKKIEKTRKIKAEEKKYKKKSSAGLGIFMIFYILFYPIFWIISLPFMIISNFTGSSEKYSPNKAWNDWWNTKS